MPNLQAKIQALREEHDRVYMSVVPQLQRLTFLEGQMQSLQDLLRDEENEKKAAAEVAEKPS